MFLLKQKHNNCDSISSSTFYLFMNSEAKIPLNFDLEREIILVPWCQYEHWKLIVLYPHRKEWKLMDPVGTMASDVEMIKTRLIDGYLNEISVSNWNFIPSVQERQKDSASCGMLILKYACHQFNDACLDSTSYSQSRLAIAKRLLSCKIRSEKNCMLCHMKNPNSRNSWIKWTQCDFCDRWCHNECIPEFKEMKNGSQIEFSCSLCKDLSPKPGQKASKQILLKH